ncbi:MAG: LD-carboxypeptidase [Chitinophagales bacterium]
MFLQPPLLQPGDTVALVSTARKISREEIAPAITVLEGWGLKVKVGATIGAESYQFAGDDSLRLRDFQQFIDDPDVRAVVCSRGGYGTVRIMDGIDWTGFLQSPKWIVGYSDITFLHIHLNQSLGVQTIHGSMPVNFPTNTAAAMDSLKQALFSGAGSFEADRHPLNRLGNASGSLIGGNLSILYSITGTRSGFNTDGKILVLEDLDEYYYHLDRMMMNLKRSGKLDRLAALVVGGMTDMKDNAVPFGKSAEEIILDAVKEFNYPVVFGMPFGHIPDNRTLLLGKRYHLQALATGTLFGSV